jgi:hypothetical protein
VRYILKVEGSGYSPLPYVRGGAPRSKKPRTGHVIIVVSRGGDLPGVADVTLFRLTVSPHGRAAGLDRLNFDSGGVPVTGAALSPDGRMLALSLRHEFPPGAPYGSVEVLSVARRPGRDPGDVPGAVGGRRR